MTGEIVNLRIFSVQHDRHGLAEVERTSFYATLISEALCQLSGVEGLVTLATCNRVDLILDAPDLSTAEVLQRLAGVEESSPVWDVHEGDESLGHLFRVAAGLESMVVGEREIAHQLRRALGNAQDAETASPTLTVCVEEALRTSRRIARETTLHAAGRSVVSEGLDMLGELDWERQRVLVVGTGSYAGAVVSAVRHRGAQYVSVHSASGRGQAFAESHGLIAVENLRAAVERADVIVTCRGTGGHTITADMLDRPERVGVLDLSLSRDVAPEVEGLPHVTAINLARIQRDIAPRWNADTDHANELVAEGVRTVLARLRSRVLDPVVIDLRHTALGLVTAEAERLPQGRLLDRDECIDALRRLATRLLHTPSKRAREAAEAGRADEYLNALHEVFGISNALVDGQPGPGELEPRNRPVTDISPDSLVRDPA